MKILLQSSVILLAFWLSTIVLANSGDKLFVLKLSDAGLKETIDLYSEITNKTLEGSLDKIPRVKINVYGKPSVNKQKATTLIETALMINGVLLKSKPNSFSLQPNLKRDKGYKTKLNSVFIDRFKNISSHLPRTSTTDIKLKNSGLPEMLEMVSAILNRPVIPSQDCPHFIESFSFSNISHLELLRTVDEILLKRDIVLIELNGCIFAIHHPARAYGG